MSQICHVGLPFQQMGFFKLECVCNEFGESTGLISVPNQKMHTNIWVIYFWRNYVALNTLFSPHKLILHIIHKGNMSFRNHCTFVCHHHFTGQNHRHWLLSTIHTAHFPMYTFLDLQIYWYYMAVLFYLSEESARLL